MSHCFQKLHFYRLIGTGEAVQFLCSFKKACVSLCTYRRTLGDLIWNRQLQKMPIYCERDFISIVRIIKTFMPFQYEPSKSVFQSWWRKQVNVGSGSSTGGQGARQDPKGLHFSFIWFYFLWHSIMAYLRGGMSKSQVAREHAFRVNGFGHKGSSIQNSFALLNVFNRFYPKKQLVINQAFFLWTHSGAAGGCLKLRGFEINFIIWKLLL